MYLDAERLLKKYHQTSNDFHHDDEEYYHRRVGYDHSTHKHTCWAKAFSRSSGFYPTCGKSGEQSGTYCYKKCEKGFTGVGPVCYQDCNNFGAPLPPPIPVPPVGLNSALPADDLFEEEEENKGPLGGLVSGGGDPRKGMHESTEYCYK